MTNTGFQTQVPDPRSHGLHLRPTSTSLVRKMRHQSCCRQHWIHHWFVHLFLFVFFSNHFFPSCLPHLSQANLTPTHQPIASGRDSSTNPNNYVFNACTIAAADGHSISSGAYYLGRPWREYARVTFQKTSMTNVINAAGWKIWNTGDERTSNVAFTEYANTGAGASGTRAGFSSKLGAAVKIESVLGSGYAGQGYYDGSYM